MKALRALLPARGLSALVLVLWLVLARPPSAAQLLLDGFRTAYEKFSHAISLAE